MPPKVVIGLLLVSAAWAQESRAVAYLIREVPAWNRDNRCFSCHNNGDGARALFVAASKGYKVPAEALSDTIAWLRQPGRWDSNRGKPEFSDKLLARIQFAAALTLAVELGQVPDREALRQAAASLVPLQSASGAWEVDTVSDAGSPCTYGPVLATYFAMTTVKAAGEHSAAVERATRWLRAVKPRSLVDTSALLLAFPQDTHHLQELLKSQTTDGGWAPQPNTRAEVFDTALALLALNKAGAPREAVARGRKFLLSLQQREGGWPETTRPSGSQSYAQHISTTAWAAMALILTNRERH